jgi:hypothetical protein
VILELQKGACANHITAAAWTTCICGAVLDERGQAAHDEMVKRSNVQLQLTYNPDTFELDFDGTRIGVDSFSSAAGPLFGNRIVLESTTLGFVEILLCCRTFCQIGVSSFDLLYVEPEGYRNPSPRDLLNRRDFELSSDVPGYRAIPGNAILLGDRIQNRGVFFLGYEEARLRRAFEELQMIRPASSIVTFGVPAFRPGWEMDSIANNIGVIREHNILGGVYFCGAENPAAVVDLLIDLREGLAPGERLFIAPIGTKPHGIGAALFGSTHADVGIIYDHPRRTRGRTSKIAHWHLYTVRDFGT